MTDEFLTVSELNNYIKDVINAGFPQTLWVCGEIQGYDRNKSKDHVFFDLIEKDFDSQKIIAKIGMVIFSNRKEHIYSLLAKSENAFELKDDIEVKFSCQIDFYPPHGTVRLIIENIDPIYTLGKLAQERQKLILKLKEKGVFEKNKELKLPLVPLNIGLITAEDSAAYNDFLSEINRSGYGFKVYVRNTLMQGKRTERDVVKALDELEKVKNIDVIVITRGGGSIADLSFFDSEKIAERIAKAKLPVFSGIGHEINLSITDMVAHTYAKTPTAVAQFIIERIKVFLLDLEKNFNRLTDLVEDRLAVQKNHLRNHALNLQNNTMGYLKGYHKKLIHISEFFKSQPATLLKDQNRLTKDRNDLLIRVLKLRFDNDKKKLANYTKMVDILHPANTMKRGFSITRSKEGELIRTVKAVKTHEEIVTEVCDGRLISEVKVLNRGGRS